VRSHSYLHLQESGSLERGDESYHSNMFNLEEGKGGPDIESRSGESLDKIYKKRNISPNPLNNIKSFPSQE
jgi:hypothetical protein